MRSGGVALIILAAIVLGLVIAGGAYWIGRSSVNTGEMTTEVTVVTEPTSEPTLQPVQLRIEMDASVPSTDKPALNDRVINPLLDYYSEANQGDVLSLVISANTQDSKVSYPYSGSVVLSSGGNLGFLISQSNGQINWWFPECMSQCPLSESYKSKYPEIAKMLGY